MIVLNREDILRCINYNEMMDTIEDAYHAYATGKFSMPLRLSEEMGKNKDTLLLMPCVNELGFGTKMLTLFPENAKKGKPYIDGLMVLNDQQVGETLAILDAKILTALRTGAVGGVAVKHLAPEKAETLGLIGCGMQGYYQAIYGATARKIKVLNIYDQREGVLEGFAEMLAKELGEQVKINICSDSKELLASSDIIMAATTATEPVIADDPELIKNKCFIGIGSYKPFMIEYPRSVTELSEVIYMDTDHALEETGDLITPLKEGWIKEDKIKLFSEIITDGGFKKPKTVFFKSVGMALFDLFAAQKIYGVAQERGIGQKIKF
jgi:ornithine cyclodeaminase